MAAVSFSVKSRGPRRFPEDEARPGVLSYGTGDQPIENGHCQKQGGLRNSVFFERNTNAGARCTVDHSTVDCDCAFGRRRWQSQARDAGRKAPRCVKATVVIHVGSWKQQERNQARIASNAPMELLVFRSAAEVLHE